MLMDSFLCFSLHTGTVILGWYGFCSAFLSVIGCSTYFGHIDEFINSTFNTSTSNMTSNDIEFLRDISVTTIAVMIGLYVIECLASLFIIYGASNVSYKISRFLIEIKLTFLLLFRTSDCFWCLGYWNVEFNFCISP